jgi:hypothetical protein
MNDRVAVGRSGLEIIGAQDAKGGGHDFKAYKDAIGKTSALRCRLTPILDDLG